MTTDPQNPDDFSFESCYRCGKSIKVIRESAMLVYLTDSTQGAEQRGFHGYCDNCRHAFCSRHSRWRPIEPGQVYVSTCPDCGKPLSGRD